LATPAIVPMPNFILSADLFEQLHFGAPVQRVSSASGFARIRVPVRSSGWAKTNCRTEPDQNTEISRLHNNTLPGLCRRNIAWCPAG
jgi:hypothetical protein